MITGELRSTIDKLWTDFWTGGITNPITVIEQISFLMFARLLDLQESREEKKSARTGKDFQHIFAPDEQAVRWSSFKHKAPEEMLTILRDRVFPHFRTVTMNGVGFGEFMQDAQLMIVKPSLLAETIAVLDQLPLDKGDTKGDLYEYLLGKLTTAGIAGQFRTPRHLIRAMVELVDPQPTDVICDPACGTAGFLVSALQYLYEQNTSPEAVIEEDVDGTIEKTYTGDRLEPYLDHINTGMFHGFDFDATMLRISTMNLLTHGIAAPNINYRDTLSNSFPEKFPQRSENFFDVILARMKSIEVDIVKDLESLEGMLK